MRKKIGHQLTDRSVHGGVSMEQVINKANHFQIHVLPGNFILSQLLTIIATAPPPPTTPAVFCSQCQRRVGVRLHCCCHKASAITSN